MSYTLRGYRFFKRYQRQLQQGMSKFKFYVSLFLFLFVVMSIVSSTISYGAEDQLPKRVDVCKTYKHQWDADQAKTENVGPSNLTSKASDVISGATIGIEVLGGDEVFACNGEPVQTSNLSPVYQGGLIGITMNNLEAMLFNPPSMQIPTVMAYEWAPGYRDDVNATYAQSAGYEYLKSTGLLEIHNRFKLIAYLGLVVVVVITGFMIMLRHKLGGQTVVTVYNTLPNILFGVVLITFSFMIVGLIINFSAILTTVVAGALFPSSMTDHFSYVDSLFWGLSVSPELLTAGWKSIGFSSLSGVLVGALVSAIASGPVLSTVAGVGAAAGGIILLGSLLLLFGLVVWLSVQVYLTVLKAYFNILLDMILGPIYIMLGTVPGMKHMTVNWFKRLIRNALTFPMVFFLVNLGIYILTNPNISLALTHVGLGRGDLTGDPSHSAGFMLRLIVMFYLFLLAKNSPQFLNDFIPLSSGQGAAQAAEATKKDMSSMPVIGSFFK